MITHDYCFPMVVGFVSAIICLLHPFQIQASNVLRDVCFFIFGIFFIDYALATDNVVTVWESAGK